MSEWHEKLKGYKHRVIIDQYITLYNPDWCKINFSGPFLSLKEGLLIIKKGYAWDGASGPVIQTETLIDASALHDALYQILRSRIMNIEALRRYADRRFVDEYLKLCKEAYPKDTWWHRLNRNLAEGRSKYIHWAVRKYGAKHIRK